MALSRQQLALLSALVDKALELPAHAREGWIEDLTEPFPGVRGWLRKMFAQQGGTVNLLSTLSNLGTSEAAGGVGAGSLSAGARVGPYELIRLLGSGGMAEVWLARRADGAIKREVALKIPQLLHWREDLAQRFARERDILASLEHPHIARLYDVGSDAQGCPYLAMEYVQGQTLTKWCDAHQLSIPERLKLFLQVLDAVQYAHERQVIHRDLKPSNILVTDSGQVRLLDFGIAKLLEEEAEHTQLTSAHGRALTPDYASPEMLRGDAIDTRSDVYALGVILYELLSGGRPYRLQAAASIGVLQHAIGTLEVEKPSTRIEAQASGARATIPERLSRQLRGDLDLISLKALAKDPQDRYQGAAELAEDLQRYLDGHPVKAHRARFWYRTRKWFTRHRSIAALMTTMVVVLMLALIGYSLQRRAAKPGADMAAAVFTPPPHSLAVLPFVNMSGDAQQEYFSDGIAEELLNSLSRLKDLQVVARTSSFSFKGQNVNISTIAHKLNVGAILEGSVRRAGSTVRITVQLINAVSGFHMWSQTYDQDLTDILKLQTEVANSVAQQLEVKLASDESDALERGATKDSQAYDAYLRGEQLLIAWDTGEDGLRAALAAFDQAIARDPNYAWAYIGRTRALATLSIFVAKPNERDELRQWAREAAERAVALAPDLGEAHAVLAVTHAYGLLDFAGAVPEYDRALALAGGSAYVQRMFAAFSSQMGHHDVAIGAARRALNLDPQNVQTQLLLGQILANAHRFSEALTVFQHALVLSPGSRYIDAQRFYALLGSGQIAQAQQLCESTATPLEDDERHECLALVYHALGQRADADRELEQVKAIEGDRWAFAYAEIYAQWGDTAAALQWLSRAEQLRDPNFQVLRVSWLLDPIRNEPQFKAIEARLKFPP